MLDRLAIGHPLARAAITIFRHARMRECLGSSPFYKSARVVEISRSLGSGTRPVSRPRGRWCK
jgi:hypothetical protein